MTTVSRVDAPNTNERKSTIFVHLMEADDGKSCEKQLYGAGTVNLVIYCVTMAIGFGQHNEPGSSIWHRAST